MSHVPVQCPDCKRLFVVNGRGTCSCGAYLVYHAGKPGFIPTNPRTWFWENGEWVDIEAFFQGLDPTLDARGQLGLKP